MIKLFRKRYIIFQIISKKRISHHNFLQKFEEILSYLYGIRGKIKYGIELVEFNEEKQGGIISCYHKAVPYVRIILLFIFSIEEEKVLINVVKVTGTLKRARQILEKFF